MFRRILSLLISISSFCKQFVIDPQIDSQICERESLSEPTVSLAIFRYFFTIMRIAIRKFRGLRNECYLETSAKENYCSTVRLSNVCRSSYIKQHQGGLIERIKNERVNIEHKNLSMNIRCVRMRIFSDKRDSLYEARVINEQNPIRLSPHCVPYVKVNHRSMSRSPQSEHVFFFKIRFNPISYVM